MYRPIIILNAGKIDSNKVIKSLIINNLILISAPSSSFFKCIDSTIERR